MSIDSARRYHRNRSIKSQALRDKRSIEFAALCELSWRWQRSHGHPVVDKTTFLNYPCIHVCTDNSEQK